MPEKCFKGKIFRHAAILGTGLMGASMGMALRERALVDKVSGYDRDPSASRTAVERGALDKQYSDPGTAVKDADLVVLAVPVRCCMDIVREVSPFLKEGAIITDLGSTKSCLLNECCALFPETVTYIGGHPMTGSEESGAGASDPAIWENAIYVLTPTEDVSREKTDKLKSLVESIGAQPLIMNPEEHDNLVALVSHLPHIVAVALVNTAARSEKDELIRTLAAGGFRDTTRIAMGNPEMWNDICATNQKAINQYIDQYIDELKVIRELINSGKESRLLSNLNSAKEYRKTIPYRSRGILPELFDLIVLVKDTPGIIGKIAGTLGEAKINIAEIEILHVREEEGGSIRIGFRSAEQRDKALETMKAYKYTAHRR